MRRWLPLALGLALAGTAVAWWLATEKPAEDVAAGPHADIDPASRAALEKILEEADRKEGRAPAEPEAGPPR